MAISQCLRCGSHSFESVIKNPIGYPRRVMFIQCAVCGGVVGVQEEHPQRRKMNAEQNKHKPSSAHTYVCSQTGVPSDISTVLKRLYG